MYELAQAMTWEQSRLLHHLSRMQKRGLVERVNCDSNRRGAFVVLTAAGRQAIEAAAPAHVNSVRELVLDGLDAAQVRALGSVSAIVLQRLEDTAPAGH